jgi:hypothetical protein
VLEDSCEFEEGEEEEEEDLEYSFCSPQNPCCRCMECLGLSIRDFL